jgi:outer membrane protein TolC
MEQLQITLTSIKSNLNNTIRLKAIAYQMLNITLGLPLEHPTKVSDNLETLTNLYIASTIIDLPNNVKNTVTYKIADNDKVSKELLVRLEQSKALPSLSVFLTGGYNSFSNDFKFFNKDQDYFGYAVFGANLNIPIFSSGFRSARTQRAKIELEKAENNLIDTEQRVKLAISSAKSDFRFTVEDYQNKQQNLLLARRIETKNETKFFEGIASSFDLRQAQTQLYRAQQELLQAMLDVVNSNAELEAVLNTPINN